MSQAARRLIVTADDFGLSWAVNEAVERAARDGILTCASLMVGEEAAADAVARARRIPALRVGLHVVVADGRPVLAPERIPALCDAHGRLDGRLVRAGFRFFFRPQVRRQLEDEIEAQFAAFARTGLALDHVNAHKHMHLHPTVLGLILSIGRRYGMRAVRLPYEPPLVAVSPRTWREHWKATSVIGLWTWLMRQRLDRAGVLHNDAVLGLLQSGAMDESSVLALLKRLPSGVTELYCHPAIDDDAQALVLGYGKKAEFEALVSRKVAAALQEDGVVRVGFGDLG
ncbi:MAG: hopanoid biosynthesis-associated protein HpnK [Acidiferrobacter sp.]